MVKDQVKADWSSDRENGISQLQAQIQQLEQENTDFLAALEDAMEQYKQQVSQASSKKSQNVFEKRLNKERPAACCANYMCAGLCL